MLTLIRSNQVERLLAQLADRLVREPPASPFEPVTVVTPSPAMARWVNLRLAGVSGVAANLRYPLPAGFVWQLARSLLEDMPERDPLALESMGWRIFALLSEREPGVLARPECGALRRYLRDDEDGRKRRRLAVNIADVFDRCQLYRPELIQGWIDDDDNTDGASGPRVSGRAPSGRATAWQGTLWRALTRDCADQHRVAVLQRLCAVLTDGDRSEARLPGGIPPRIALFAVSTLPPILVRIFRALARHSAVDLYLHTPTDAFWADLVSQKQLARKRLQSPEDAELWEVANPLLGSWGRQGQAFQDLLLEEGADAGEDPLELDTYALDWPDTLLGQLQRDLFQLTAVPPPEARRSLVVDDSLQVHLCHSPARECQALHDALLRMFEAEPDLRPEEILVMVPEIGRYAPDIEAVFDRHRPDGGVAEVPSDQRHIPWNLSDIALADEDALAGVFLKLLALPESRFTQSEITSLLDVPELAERFELDTSDVDRIKAWLASTNLRWGLDAAHKSGFDLPAVEQNTWAQAQRRLFAGYALGEEADGGRGFAGIVPVSGVEGAGAAALGRFWRLMERLRSAASRLAEPRGADDWQRELARLLTDFFGERDDPAGRLRRLRETIAEFAEEARDLISGREARAEGRPVGVEPTVDPNRARGPTEPLSLALVRDWFTERLAETGDRRGGRYFSGGVTFCGMRPMRSLPFKVICVLGMDDLAYPRRERPIDFDPMGRSWRPGDPRKGDEDRYLFLETLLGARRRLYLSCVGRDIRTDEPRQPSVLLRELLDHLDQYFVTDDAASGGGSISAAITRTHPLQPFSPGRFEADAPSYDADWCGIARSLGGRAVDAEASVAEAWPSIEIDPPPEPMREVTLPQLARFLAHPVRYFVQARLGVRLEEDEAEPDDEPFALDRLTGWSLKTRLLQGFLTDDPLSQRMLEAEGLLPHGAPGALALERERNEVLDLEAALAPYRGETAARLDLDLHLGAVSGPPRTTDAAAVQASDQGAGLPAGGDLGWRLSGEVDGLYPGLGLLRWRAGRLRGVDRLELWLMHLARWAVADASLLPEPEPSKLLTLDDELVLRAAPTRAAARAALSELLALYWRGLHRPLPIFPRASFAYAEHRRADNAGTDEKALKAARAAWLSNDFSPVAGDEDDPYVRLILRQSGYDPATDPEFARLACALYEPVLAAAEGEGT